MKVKEETERKWTDDSLIQIATSETENKAKQFWGLKE